MYSCAHMELGRSGWRLFRRLKTGRVGPILHMRGGLAAPGFPQQGVALTTGRKLGGVSPGFFGHVHQMLFWRRRASDPRTPCGLAHGWNPNIVRVGHNRQGNKKIPPGNRNQVGFALFRCPDREYPCLTDGGFLLDDDCRFFPTWIAYAGMAASPQERDRNRGERGVTRRGEKRVTLQDRLTKWAEGKRREASGLSPGPERDALLKKARHADTAAHLDDWVNSAGLQPPK